jgi:formyltetrahydrofolate-dependent phosphoribosylglycinamide formyltransferase
MFQKLQQKWKVSGGRLFLIILTFALGGSLCGYAGRKLLAFSNLEKGVLWVTTYIILITLLWPLCVLLVSIPLGQFAFFKKYIRKLWRRVSPRGSAASRARIAIFASGAGTNAQKIIDYFSGSREIEVALVVCNKPGAGVIQIAKDHHIEVMMIGKETFYSGTACLQELIRHRIDWIVLAGFLWKIPDTMIHTYRNRIINIHPALLPKYGGKGMYGNRVHEAVLLAGDTESGISIHFADEVYDHGKIILQATCAIEPGDDVASLAAKIHRLEHEHYPRIIEETILKKQKPR